MTDTLLNRAIIHSLGILTGGVFLFLINAGTAYMVAMVTGVSILQILLFAFFNKDYR